MFEYGRKRLYKGRQDKPLQGGRPVFLSASVDQWNCAFLDPRRVLMDDNFGTRVGLQQGQFDLVRDFMRLEKLYVAVHLQMELDEIGRPGSKSQIMNRVNALVRERDMRIFSRSSSGNS